MANLGIEIKRKCQICGKVFIIKTLDSVYCSPKCSKVANKRKKDKEKKEALFATYAQQVPDIREYLTARQVVAIYGVERSTLYRLAKLGKIPGSHEKPCGLCVDFCQSEQEKLSIYDATQQSPELFHFCIKGFSRCICRPIDKVVKDFILSVIHSCRYIIEGFIPKFSYFAIP